MKNNNLAIWTLFLVVSLAAVFAAVAGSRAQPPASILAGPALQTGIDMQSSLIEPIATNLCGRGLGGRCTKGRAACSRGTPAQCAAWKNWSAGCTSCAQTFAKCRQRVGQSYKYTCDRCLAAHDACEGKIRVAR